MRTYLVTLSSDSGPYTLQSTARNRKAVIRSVMADAQCPRRAIKIIDPLPKKYVKS